MDLIRRRRLSIFGHIARLTEGAPAHGDEVCTLNLFSVNIHVHQKPSSTIFREGIRLGLVYRVRVSFR